MKTKSKDVEGIYERVKTRELLPDRGGYYAIETEGIHGHVHWSVEDQIWTLEDGTKWEGTYPNYWLNLKERAKKH